MKIRRAILKDMQRIDALLLQVELIHHKARPDLFKNGGRKYTDAQLAVILADDTRPILVAADENDRVQGYAFCILQQHKADTILTGIKTLYLDDLCVDEAARGQHIGNQLYRAVLDLARELDCYNVTLNVWEGNDAALRFYRACGLKTQKTGMEAIL